MRFSFRVQGSSAEEVQERALEVLEQFAPGAAVLKQPDMTMTIHARPLAESMTGNIVLWEGDVDGDFNLHAVRASVSHKTQVDGES